MMSTKTKEINIHFMRMLAVLAMMVASCVVAVPSAHASTTFTVNSVADFSDLNAGDGSCDAGTIFGFTQCTLRAAIQEANATPGADTIRFGIIGSGVHTISPDTALPPITDTVTIDGYTQPGASPNSRAVGDDAVLRVELDGSKVPVVEDGLNIDTADSSVIRGLAINRFGTGVAISGDSVANRIEGNFIGINPAGTLDRGNSFNGVALSGGSSTIIGGDTPASRNVLSGNRFGIITEGASSTRIEGNYVGTDRSGTKDLGNEAEGLLIHNSPDNTVGGTKVASRNVISGNGSDGLLIEGSRNAKVFGNRIGTTANGAGALGNDFAGVDVIAADGTVGDGTPAGANTIGFNGQQGIVVVGETSTSNTISRNSIFSNGSLGIDLVGGFEDVQGNTANDPGDIDTGANGLQNKPVLTSARTVSGKTAIAGKLRSNPDAFLVIQFFSNPSGNEGKKFIGQKSVNTDGSGKASFTFRPASVVPVGQTVTTTATRPTTRNTSEFSAPQKVTT